MFCFLTAYKNFHILLEGLAITLCATLMETVLIHIPTQQTGEKEVLLT